MYVLLENKYLRENIITLKNEYPEKFGIFIIALKNLEESDDWSRICGIHGNTFKPNDPGVLCPTDSQIVTLIAQTGEPTYCPHSNVKFVAWHTPYLYQFEILLNSYNTSSN
jgi:tyrosinase